MDCPKCCMRMEKVGFGSIVVERCSGCQGLLFDSLEEDHLKNIEAARLIDIGDPNRGEEWNREKDIKCPHCHIPMESRVDTEQSHIEFEHCPKCYAVFFDAGEFKDYEEKTVVEFFSNLIK
jgi:uncharacterized protein